jgi:hypothetical protein
MCGNTYYTIDKSAGSARSSRVLITKLLRLLSLEKELCKLNKIMQLFENHKRCGAREGHLGTGTNVLRGNSNITFAGCGGGKSCEK